MKFFLIVAVILYFNLETFFIINVNRKICELLENKYNAILGNIHIFIHTLIINILPYLQRKTYNIRKIK